MNKHIPGLVKLTATDARDVAPIDLSLSSSLRSFMSFPVVERGGLRQSAARTVGSTQANDATLLTSATNAGAANLGGFCALPCRYEGDPTAVDNFTDDHLMLFQQSSCGDVYAQHVYVPSRRSYCLTNRQYRYNGRDRVSGDNVTLSDPSQ